MLMANRGSLCSQQVVLTDKLLLYDPPGGGLAGPGVGLAGPGGELAAAAPGGGLAGPGWGLVT